jgi:hypothetical protein
MQSTFSALVRHNTRQKIEAICLGLALCSLALTAAWAVGIEARTSVAMLDDHFFGQRRPLLPGYFLAETFAMMAVVYLLPRRARLAVGIGLGVTSFFLAETLFDLRTFASDPHLVVEELAFALIYLALFVLLCAERINQRANPVPNRASAPSALEPQR